ncbi:MAG: hypothetical protein V3W28_00530 [Thermoplasmata archaeon]
MESIQQAKFASNIHRDGGLPCAEIGALGGAHVETLPAVPSDEFHAGL